MLQAINKRILLCILPILLFSGCLDEGGDIAVSEFGSNTSAGGSLASFTIVNNHLYAVNTTSIIPVDITDLGNPEVLDIVNIGTGVETIFPYKDQLFIGSNSALFVYDISNPARPMRSSFFQHATGCDPVVVKDDYAYVTIRDGVSCNNTFQLNVLDVIDVSDPTNTFLVTEIALNNPRGLATGCDNKLYVCDGAFGLHQFDITDPREPILETTYTEFFANDVIVRDDLVILIGEDGIHQFRCTEEGLTLLSDIPISF